MRPLGFATVLVVASALLSGCGVAHLRMPDGLAADAVAYEVSGHSPRRFNEPVRFGPYSALQMREGATFSWRVPLAGFDVGRTAKPYGYTMVARGLPPVEVQCRTRAWTAGAGDVARRISVDLTAVSGPLLGCGLRLDAQPAQVLRVAREADGLRGRLPSPWGREYAVRALYGYQGTPIRGTVPTGYAITDGAAVLAVVDVINRGHVHLDRHLDDDQRVYFAAAAAALLLLDPELGE